MRKNTKGICDQVKSQRRIRAAYEDKNNKGRIDYKRRQYPLELYQDRIKKCDLATYGQRIRDLRKEKGVSQKTFAEQIGTTTATLSKIESGKIHTVNIDLMYNICGIYNTNPSYLIGETGHPLLSEGVHPITKKPCKRMEALNSFSYVAGELCQELQLPEDEYLEEMDKQYQEQPELCVLMLTILLRDDKALKKQATDVLRGLVQSAEYRWSQGG